MAKTAILAIRIISDAKSGIAGMKDAADGAGKFEAASKKAAVGATVVVGAIAAIAKEAGQAASALEQATGSVESVYGSQAGAVMDLAEGAATAVGLSTSAYAEMASVLGAQLKNMGVAENELIGTTDNLITMGADLAATFGGTTAEAVGALGSLFRGEADPIERYGVTIKQADVNARVAAMGLDGLEGSALRTAETQARLALLTEQTASSTGQFARETDTAAVSQQIANATMEDAKAALGEGLLPLMVLASQAIAAFAEFTRDNSEAVSLLGGVLITAAAAVWLVNLAMAANPIGIIIGLFAALVAGVIVAYNQFEGFRAVVDTVGNAIRDMIDWVVDGIGWLGRLGGAKDEANSRSVEVDAARTMTTRLMSPTAADVGSYSVFSAPAARFSEAPAARMAAASTLLAAPARLAALAAGSAGAGGTTTEVHNHNYELKVEGHVVDRMGAGRAIEQLLKDARRASGERVGNSSGAWA